MKDKSGKVPPPPPRGASNATGAATSSDPPPIVEKDGTLGALPNPLTRLIVTDILMRSGTRLMRHAVQRQVLGKVVGSDAKKVMAQRGLVEGVAGALVARLATRSVPGALLVGGGLLAKTLYDRAKARKKAEQGISQPPPEPE